MKNWGKKQKALAFAFALCLGAAAMAGCGKKETGDAAGGGEELKKFEVEEVGTFYLPEGFEVTDSGIDESMLPMGYAVLTKDNMTVRGNRFGTDAYEAAGLPLPEDLEEYSTREGVRSSLPEGAEFAEDAYGNLFVQYTEDGTFIYQVLKKGAESYGAVLFTCPEGEEKGLEFAQWLSKAELH